jgi:hypothetical protein
LTIGISKLTFDEALVLNLYALVVGRTVAPAINTLLLTADEVDPFTE